MRILHVITSADPKFGGPIEGVKQRAKVLVAQGHQVEVATVDDPSGAFVKDFPLPLYALGPGKSSLQVAPKLLEWLLANASGYDAVIANGIWQYPCWAVHQACKKLKKPYLVFTHGMLDPWFNKAYPLKKLKKQLFWPCQHPVLRDAAAVLFTCEEEKLLARQSFSPYNVKERVVAYGTSTPTGDPEAQIAALVAKFPELSDSPFLLFLSRIHPKKGVDLLLEAGKSTKAKLAIAGPVDDAYKAELQAIAKSAGVEDQVVWMGMLQGDLKYGAFRKAEAFILPSHQENFGIAVVEALACETPVLITKPVNIWREIEQDDAGLVAEDTVEGVRSLLESWNNVPADRREQMGKNAKKCFENRFTIEGSATSLLDAIREELH
ncbi:glycosyltransferase [soil metagenome]